MLIYSLLILASVLMLLLLYDPNVSLGRPYNIVINSSDVQDMDASTPTSDGYLDHIGDGMDVMTQLPPMVQTDDYTRINTTVNNSETTTVIYSDVTEGVAVKRTRDRHHFDSLLLIDRILVWFFCFEILFRFLVCPQKFGFLKDKFNLIDIVAVVPRAAIAIMFEMSLGDIGQMLAVSWVQTYIKISSVLRVVRLINLARHYIASRVFLVTMWESRKEIMLLLSLYVAGATFFAVSVFYCEQGQSDPFPTMASGIWWALITMTTVGYGDMWPHTELGKAVGVMCAFSGVICTALPIAVIATNYNIIYRTAKVRAKLNGDVPWK